LLRAQRQELHARIAAVLEEQFPETAETQPEIFAHHFAEAGLVEKSVASWGKAGERSTARSAMAEAAAQYQKALDQLALLPDSRERQWQELVLRVALGPVLRISRGQAAPETGSNGERAWNLWEEFGCPPQFLHLAYYRARYHGFRGELDLARRLNEDLIRLSRQHNDSAGVVLGHFSSGQSLELAGHFASSRSHLEKALSLYDSMAQQSLVDLSSIQKTRPPIKINANPTLIYDSIHPHILSKAQLGLTLVFLGFSNQATTYGDAALAEARQVAHTPTLAIALAYTANRLLLTGATAALEQTSEELVAVANEQGYPHYRGQGTIYRGWSTVEKGDVAEGISLLRTGLSVYRATGATGRLTFYILLLARACGIGGHIEEGLSLLDEPLKIAEETGERWVEAEPNRQKG
jgi:predicted ATPase